MTFYALRILCRSCGASFLIGGSTANDLTRWRGVQVACSRCSAESSTAGAEAVTLRAEVLRPSRPATPAASA